MLGHHITSMTALFAGLLTGTSGSGICAVVGGTESTNPLLQARWFYKQGPHSKALLWFIDTLFVATFGIVRLGWGGILMVVGLRDPECGLWLKAGGLSMMIISTVWFVMMVKKYCHLYLWTKHRKD